MNRFSEYTLRIWQLRKWLYRSGRKKSRPNSNYPFSNFLLSFPRFWLWLCTRLSQSHPHRTSWLWNPYPLFSPHAINTNPSPLFFPLRQGSNPFPHSLMCSSRLPSFPVLYLSRLLFLVDAWPHKRFLISKWRFVTPRLSIDTRRRVPLRLAHCRLPISSRASHATTPFNRPQVD
jgi:hypothetical protein